MGISEFSGTPQRTRIGFVEQDPPVDAVKELGSYDLYRLEVSHLEDRTLAATEAVMVLQSSDKPRRAISQLAAFAPRLLWHDCRVLVHPVVAKPGMNAPTFRRMIVDALNDLRLPPSGLNEEDAGHLGSWFEGINAPRLTPCVHVVEDPGNWRHIATVIRNNPAGVAASESLRIIAVDSEGNRLDLTPEQEVLVRRAFWNCESVRLVGLGNGLSGVPAFRAFAHLLQGAVGSKWPYLYFVKIGERSKIAKEYMAYQANALENVPYHLGPRLRLDRCGLGHTQGIIVSDYVSGAETLRDCAKDGRAAPAIANLFNSTLWAWRNGADQEKTSLQDLLAEHMPSQIPSHRKPLIEAYGASHSPDELRALFMKESSRPVLVGVVHGDLHATNVLVRGNDAIIIDFEKVGMRKPLLLDFASLEGGLFVDGFIGDRRTGTQLVDSLACLYEAGGFHGEVAPCHPSDASAWFFECVRQIRMQARQLELAPLQYACALAAALAHKACNEKDFRLDATREPSPSCPLSREDVRALAYILAERILVGMTRQGGRDSE